MEFVFVRHGQPEWSRDGISQPDPRLTDIGQRQAQHMAERLAGGVRPVTEILVSPALRSQQTATPLAEATGLQPVTIPDIVEIRNPDWTDQPEAEVQRIFDEARLRPPEEWWDGITGGESFRDFHIRITSAVRGILGDRGIAPDRDGRPHLWDGAGDDRRVVVVAHAGTNSVALTFLLGVEPTPWEWERFVLGHASLARVCAIPLAGDHVFSLRSFNDQEHLPRALRSR